MLKAAVIHPGKIHDLGDLVKVARSVGQELFKTHENVRVLPEVFLLREGGYVIVVEFPCASSKSLVVSDREMKRSE